MTNKLDLSLDDIIKINKKLKMGSGQKRVSQKSGKVVLVQKHGKIIKGKRNNQKPKQQKAATYSNSREVNLMQSAQGVKHGKGRGRSLGAVTQPKKLVNKKNLILTHGKATAKSVSNAGRGSGKSGKILVTNLDFGVSDDDIKKLFSNFGTIRRVAVHYDQSGKSLGSADVHFQKRIAASKAQEKYNGVPLDGRAMHIHLIDEKEPSRVQSSEIKSSADEGNLRRSQRPSRGALTRSRGRGRGRQIGRRQEKKSVSAEDLDKQLDSYISQTH